jgi:quinohemoprotein ethanol dehydrogenase
MRMRKANSGSSLLHIAVLALALLLPSACQQEAQPDVTLEDWQTIGGSPSEQFYSSLDRINDTNVTELGLAWYADFDTRRGQEANVVMVDGALYTSTAWSKVYAFDARTGEERWMFDPEVPGKTAYKACCDVVNRGVAVAGGKVFVGALDGRLIALDAKTGIKLWDVQTVDTAKPYTITGAPRVAGDLVIIGNGGADFGVRGYVSAYEAATGKLAWRFYLVPGDPAKGPDGAASDAKLADMLETWSGDWYNYGGGGTAWDAIVYDEEFGQVLVGTGNGSPWNRRIRSDGKGDNLFLSSIVALDAKTGAYKWHFQETPGEAWDYTATQTIVLADLRISGEVRKVAMHAPKNGFFYVIDRKDGAFVSANNFTEVNWATGVDAKTGRPIENPEARYEATGGKVFALRPAFLGAHSWHPMAYSPRTGLVYIPTQEIPFSYADQQNFTYRPGEYNVGADTAEGGKDAETSRLRGAMVAWDPVKQREAWRIDQATPGNGGILATGGNLVFQGSPDGTFNAYDARDGSKLWTAQVQSGVVAAAATYLLDGAQYVAVLAGLGGSNALFAGVLPRPQRLPNGRLLVFKLGGKAKLPEAPLLDPPPNPPRQVADAATVAMGARFFGYCATCHGAAAKVTAIMPDLRRTPALTDAAMWKSIVYDGALMANGMVSFKDKLTPDQVEAIRLYVGEEARKLQQEADAGK